MSKSKREISLILKKILVDHLPVACEAKAQVERSTVLDGVIRLIAVAARRNLVSIIVSAFLLFAVYLLQ